MRTGSRGADSYYIGLAGLLNAVLVTSDRVQAQNAKRAGIQAYYALKDLSEVLQHLGCTVDAGQQPQPS